MAKLHVTHDILLSDILFSDAPISVIDELKHQFLYTAASVVRFNQENLHYSRRPLFKNFHLKEIEYLMEVPNRKVFRFHFEGDTITEDPLKLRWYINHSKRWIHTYLPQSLLNLLYSDVHGILWYPLVQLEKHPEMIRQWSKVCYPTVLTKDDTINAIVDQCSNIAINVRVAPPHLTNYKGGYIIEGYKDEVNYFIKVLREMEKAHG